MSRSSFLVATLFIALLPTQISTFSVYWNVPSWTCFKNKINLSLETYGIKAHPEYTFYGGNVVIFYEFTFGLYPYLKNYNKSHPVNGGLPQNTDLTAHLLEVEKNITKLIPDKNFAGFGVIDIEEWRPLFEQHSGNSKAVYQTASIELIKRNKPSLSDEEARQQAEVEFNEAAKKFIVETMRKAKQMRPKALWGLYGFPYCNYDAGTKDGDFSCSQKYKNFNDKMQYIYDESTALFPSIYLGFPASPERRFRYVQAILTEAFRIANKYNPPLPVYPYSKFEYNPLKELDSFYDSSDLCTTVKQPAELGVDGLILWSSSANMKDRCDKIKTYVEGSFGPKIQQAIQEREQCKKAMNCMGNQKCVLKSSKWPHPYSDICSSTSSRTKYIEYECI